MLNANFVGLTAYSFFPSFFPLKDSVEVSMFDCFHPKILNFQKIIDGNFGSNKSNLYYFLIKISVNFGLGQYGRPDLPIEIALDI